MVDPNSLEAVLQIGAFIGGGIGAVIAGTLLWADAMSQSTSHEYATRRLYRVFVRVEEVLGILTIFAGVVIMLIICQIRNGSGPW